MASKKDIELLEEYEELIVLLRQLHSDVPVLEGQHRSIQQAFVSAQTKLENTITDAGVEIQSKKKQILADFEKECNAVAERVLLNLQSKLTSAFQEALVDVQKACGVIASTTLNEAETRVAGLLKEVQAKEKSVNSLMQKAETAAQQPVVPVEKPKKRTAKNDTRDSELEDGVHCTGRYISEELASHIGRDLFVKRIGQKSGRAWNNDFCMFVTEVANGMIYGDRYKDGKLYDEHVGYDLSDFFMIYRGPSEKAILKSRGR